MPLPVDRRLFFEDLLVAFPASSPARRPLRVSVVLPEAATASALSGSPKLFL